MSSPSSQTSSASKSKREAIKRTFSSRKSLGRSSSNANNDIKKVDAPRDQLTNPDQYDRTQNDYIGTNKFGDATGFLRIAPPTLAKSPNRQGKGEREVATDSGVFRRYGFQKELFPGDGNINPKNCLISRPLPDYIDGTAASIFNRAVLCWPKMKFINLRIRDPKTRKMTDNYSSRTLEDLNYHAECLAKALIGFEMVEEREFHDETYPNAKKLKNLAMMFPNREEFLVAEQACNKARITMVPVYPSLGIDACKAILQEVQSKALICDLKTLMKLSTSETAKSGSWGVEHLILLDSIQSDLISREMDHFREGSQEYEKFDKMVRVMGFKSVIRFGNLLELGASLKNGTVYPTDKIYPKVAKRLGQYHNASFAVDVDSYELYNKSPYSEYYKNFKKPASVVFEKTHTNDVQTICYTSGTTGLPKGVLITHLNITSVSGSTAASCFQTQLMDFGLNQMGEHIIEPQESSYSVLPFVHVFERIMTSFNYTLGIAISIFTQDPSQLTHEMKLCQPTIFCGVPRLFQKILAGVDELVATKGSIVQTLYNSGIESKVQYAESHGTYTHMLWDNLVFKKIKEQICGGKLKTILTGAAPMADATQYKTEALLCLNLIEGYGLTECVGACVVRIAGDRKGTVGTVLPSLEMKLEAVPEMDLADVRDQMKGEICFRGNSVTPGYFRRPDLNKETFFNGWFHTGDIGQIQGGLLSIRDRRKAIFKLSQGEYISPERVEGFLLSSLPWLESIMVTGRSTSRFACALVSLNPTRMDGWTEGLMSEDSPEELKEEWEQYIKLNKEKITKRFLADQAANMALFDMQGYEKVMAIHVMPYNVTDPDLVTPTMKIKRNRVRMAFEAEINALCDEIDSKA